MISHVIAAAGSTGLDGRGALLLALLLATLVVAATSAGRRAARACARYGHVVDRAEPYRCGRCGTRLR